MKTTRPTPTFAAHHTAWFAPISGVTRSERRATHLRECRVCGEAIKNDVRGRISHLRTHVRAGVLVQNTGNTFLLRDVDCADRAARAELFEDEINALPWKQALDYLAWLGIKRSRAVVGSARGAVETYIDEAL